MTGPDTSDQITGQDQSIRHLNRMQQQIQIQQQDTGPDDRPVTRPGTRTVDREQDQRQMTGPDSRQQQDTTRPASDQTRQSSGYHMTYYYTRTATAQQNRPVQTKSQTR